MSQTPSPITEPRDPATTTPSLEYVDPYSSQSHPLDNPSPSSHHSPLPVEVLQSALDEMREQLENLREAFWELVQQNQELTREVLKLNSELCAASRAPSMPPPPPPGHFSATPALAPPT